MHEPPKLADATLRAVFHAHYDVAIAALTFLPLGNDSASFVYRVDAPDGARFFLKVRTGLGFSVPSLVIPRYLHEQGIPHILTPLPTVTQTLWVRVGDFALSLYPFLDARTAAEVGLTEGHWRALGATLHRIHASRLPSDLRQVVPLETFVPSRRHVLTALEPVIANPGITDPIQRELARFWRSRQDRIRTLIDRADALGDQLRQASLPLVLCHADLHAWNVLLDTAQRMWLVDWDETVLAPKERDLMFVIGGIGRDLVKGHETRCFLEGYGDPPIDRRALAYYRFAWAVQDMAAYAEQVFFSPDLSERTRRDAVRAFIDLFAPGNIVAIACGSEPSTS